jgi:hypothetical protein
MTNQQQPNFSTFDDIFNIRRKFSFHCEGCKQKGERAAGKNRADDLDTSKTFISSSVSSKVKYKSSQRLKTGNFVTSFLKSIKSIENEKKEKSRSTNSISLLIDLKSLNSITKCKATSNQVS